MDSRSLLDLSINKSEINAIRNMVAGLSDIDKDKAVRKGLWKGGQYIRRGGMNRLRSRMKAGSKGKTGNLLRSFYVRVKRGSLGVLIGFTQGKDGGNHAHLVDLGTIERLRKKRSRSKGGKGGRTGAAKGNLFWTETRESDMRRAVVDVEDGITEFVNKIKGKYGASA